MESLLPSEIARLVLGYLEEQNCEEAARSFLEHSPHLSECLSVAQQGRKFSTRVMGNSLIDLLEEYCSVNSLVAERLDKLPEPAADQLLQCNGLVQKLKFLIDATRSGQTVLVSITVPPQGTPSPGNNGTPGSSSGRSRSCLQSSSERMRRTSVRLQGQETKKTKEKEEKTVRIQPVEATSLRSLPGLSDSYLDSRSTQTSHDESCVERSKDSVEISDDFQAVSSSSHCVHTNTKLFNSETDSGCTSHDNCEAISVCTSTPKRKGFPCKRKSNSPITKLKKFSASEVEQNESGDVTVGTKGFPYKRKSQSPVTKLKKSSPSENEQNDSVDITVLQQALLENKQLHEKIAENINRVMRIPGDGVVEPQIHLDATLDIQPTTCDSMMQELNQAIKTIVHQTEQDPLFERFLDEIIGPVDEEASSSPAGGDSDADDAPSSATVADNTTTSSTVANEALTSAPVADNAPTSVTMAEDPPTSVTMAEDPPTSANVVDNAQNSATISNNAPASVTVKSNCPNSLPESTDALTIEIPLKQRLRSARNKLNESCVEHPGNLTPSSKEQRRKELALEDQNAAAIQSIINANLELTIRSPHSKTTENNRTTEKITVHHEAILENVTSALDDSTKLNCIVEQSNLSKDNNLQVMKGGDNTVQPLVDNAKTPLPNRQENDIILFDGPVTYTNQMPTSSFYWDTPKNHYTVPVVLSEQSAIIKPIHNTDTTPSILITVPSLRSQPNLMSQQVVTPSDKMINESGNGQQSSTSSIIVCSEQNVSEALPTVPELYGSSDFTTFGSKKLMPIAPKGTKIAVAEIPETGEKLVFRSLSKNEVLDFFNKDDVLKNYPSNEGVKKLQKSRNKKNSTSVRSSTALEFQKLVNTLNMSTETEISDSYICQSNLDEQTNISETQCNKITSESEYTLETGLNMPVLTLSDGENVKSNNSKISENKSLEKEQIDVLVALNLKQLEQTDKLDSAKTNSESHNNKKVNFADNSLGETTIGITHSSPRLKTSNTNESNNEMESCNKDKISSKSEKEEEEGENVAVKPRQTPLVQHLNDNNRRLSLSTPRRRASHIRALDFGTPVKSGTESSAIRLSNSAPKETGRLQDSVPEKDNSTNDQRTKNVRSSLFKSPEIPTKRILPEELIGVKVDMCPIATRSPAPQLSGGWDKVTGAGLIFGDASPAYSFTSFENNEYTTNSNEDGVSKESTNSNNCALVSKNQNILAGKDASLVKNGEKSLDNLKQGTRSWDSDLRLIVSQNYNSCPESKSALNDKNVKKKKKKSPEPKKKKAKTPVKSKANKKTKASKPKSNNKGKKSKLVETTSNAIHDDLDCSDRQSTSSETCLVTEEEVQLLESQLNSSPEKAEVCISITDNSVEQIVNGSKNSESCEKEIEISVTVVQQTDCDKSSSDPSTQDAQPSHTNATKIVSPKSKPAKAKAEFGVKQTQFNNKNPINQNENSSKEADNNPAVQDINLEQPETINDTLKSIDSSTRTVVGSNVEKANSKIILLSTREEEILNISSSLQFMVTPRKLCPSQCPLTPRALSPGLMETPISNFLREQQNMDFSMIPTPNFPPTPNIAVTPNSANSNSPTSYSSRLTDYSSCSSYYKPTNTPQKLLEQILIDECNRIEANINNKAMLLKSCKTISDCSVQLVDFRKKSVSPEKHEENLVSEENVEISAVLQQTLANKPNEVEDDKRSNLAPEQCHEDNACILASVQCNEEKAGNLSVKCNMKAKPVEKASPVSKKKVKTSSTGASAVSNVFNSESYNVPENKIVKRRKKSSHTQDSKVMLDDIDSSFLKTNSADNVTNNNIKINSCSLRNPKQRIGHAVTDKPFASLLEEKKKRMLDTLKKSATKDKPKKRMAKENSDCKKTKSERSTSKKPDSDSTIEISVVRNILPSKQSQDEHMNVCQSKITSENTLSDTKSGTNCDISSSANIVVVGNNKTTVASGEADSCDVTIEKVVKGNQVTDSKSVGKSLKATKSTPEKDVTIEKVMKGTDSKSVTKSLKATKSPPLKDVTIEKVVKSNQVNDSKSVSKSQNATKSTLEKDSSCSPHKNKKINMSVDMIASRLLLEAQKPSESLNTSSEYLTITNEVCQDNDVNSDEISVEDFPNLHFSTDDDTENEDNADKNTAGTDLKKVPPQILKDVGNDLQTHVISPKKNFPKTPIVEENCERNSLGTGLQENYDNENNYTERNLNENDPEKVTTIEKDNSLDHSIEETEPVIQIEEKVHGNFIQITYQGKGPSKIKPLEEDIEKLEYTLFDEDTGYTQLTVSNFFDLLVLDPIEGKKKKTPVDKQNNESTKLVPMTESCENVTKVSLQTNKKSEKMLQASQLKAKLDNAEEKLPEKEIVDQHHENMSVKNSKKSSNKISGQESIQKLVKGHREKKAERNSKRSKAKSKSHPEEDYKSTESASTKGGKSLREKKKGAVSGENIAKTVFPAKGGGKDANEQKIDALFNYDKQSSDAIDPGKAVFMTNALAGSHEESFGASVNSSTSSRRKIGVKSEEMTLPPKKRKASTDEISVQPEEKRVCSETQRNRDLLKLVNVDMFLDKVHSESKIVD